jgi:hypothetical protein
LIDNKDEIDNKDTFISVKSCALKDKNGCVNIIAQKNGN